MRKSSVLLLLVFVAALFAGAVSAQDPTEIKVWIAFTDSRLDWAKEKAAEFNEMFPQYNVVIEGYNNYEELFTATALAAEQDSLPAVVQYFEVATQNARDSGYFKSIAEAIGDREEINGVEVAFDDFIQPVVSYYTIDGEFTSMPWNASSAIMFVNKTMLDAAGIEEIPATWGELEAACEQIMAMDEAPTYCFTWPNHGWFFEQWLAQQDATFANNDNGRTERATEVSFNNEAGVAVVTWLKDMYDKNYLYYGGGQGGNSWDQAAQAFQTQDAAIMMYSSSDVAIVETAAEENGFEMVNAFMPYNDETGWTGNLIGGASLWLTDGLEPEVEDGALTFLLWLTNAENSAEWHQITGYMPLRQSAVDLLTEEGWFEEHPNFAVAGDQINSSTITPATQGAIMGEFPPIRDLVTAAIDKVLLGDADPAEALNEAAADANEMLEEYNLLSGEE